MLALFDEVRLSFNILGLFCRTFQFLRPEVSEPHHRYSSPQQKINMPYVTSDFLFVAVKMQIYDIKPPIYQKIIAKP